jgi:hypothetical protein
MSAKIRTVEYFYATVEDRPGEACKLLSQLASADVNLLAFSAVPTGPEHTQLVLFPESVPGLARAAEAGGFMITGPQRAFLIQGDDRLGALAEIHQQLCDANINVYASTGVTDGQGGYGYVLYVRPDDFEAAARVLGC